MNEPAEQIEPAKRERPFYEPGWYLDLTNEQYHSSFGTSSSQLKKLIEKTPAHLDYDRRHPKEPTANMNLGTAVHTLVLEPETFDAEFAVRPEGLKKPTSAQLEAKKPADKTLQQIEDWQAWERSMEGRIELTAEQVETAKLMAENVKAHPVAGALLEDVIAESSIYWWYKSMDADDETPYKQMFKVRPDAISRSHSIVMDLKSCVDGSYSGFMKAIQNRYYHVSAAMYLEGVNQCKPLLHELGHFAYTKFVFICVENTAPHLVSIYELSPEYLEIGKLLYRRAAQRYQQGHEEDWPGFTDEVRVIEPPSYASYGWIV